MFICFLVMYNNIILYLSTSLNKLLVVSTGRITSVKQATQMLLKPLHTVYVCIQTGLHCKKEALHLHILF